MKGFAAVNVYVEGKGVVKTAIDFQDGKIKLCDSCVDGVVLPTDCVVVPGFIDQHIHGAAGYDAMDGTQEALKGIAAAVAKEGTTGFLATTMTQSPANITKALEAVGAYRAADYTDGAEIVGVHLEGPFISTKHIGAQPLEHVAAPDVAVFDQYNRASGNSIRIVTLAPETEGAEALMKHLTAHGIVASAGHCDACYADMEHAIKCGLCNVTHTFNAQKALHHRDIGTVGSALMFDELNCELICDTIHVSVPAIKLVLKNKPHGKVTLVTDAMRAKGLPDGLSELGGQTVIVKNGEARLENGALAGSVLKMNHAVRNVNRLCGASFIDAVDFASINPARNLGIDAVVGSIRDGKRADFAVLDGDLDVVMTVRAGHIIYQR